MEKKDFVNPIDPDKITNAPGLIAYPHHVGSSAIKPEDKGKIKSVALSAMYEQTDRQLEQIREQITLLARQVESIERRKIVSEKIYQSKIGFKPVMGNTYHLYLKNDGDYQVSMLSNTDWGSSKPNWEYISAIKLLGDHTWDVMDNHADI